MHGNWVKEKRGMPTSHFLQLNEIVELIVYTNPLRILDIGVGFGKYGFLSREFLELWGEEENYCNWKRLIDGVEAFPKYITPVHNFIYNNIFIGDALKIIPQLNTEYDLVLLIDVIEHLTFEEGIELIKNCLKIGRNLIISTPKKVWERPESFGNPYEAHKFRWLKKHFSQFEKKFFVPNPYSLICYIGDDAPRVRKMLIKRKIGQSFPLLKKALLFFKKIFNNKKEVS